MNLRCAFCQTPFTLGRIDKLIALQYMDAEKLTHYDAHCPRCRKATPVQRQMMEATFPNWRDALHELEAKVEPFDETQGKAAPASPPKPEVDSVPQAGSKPTHKSRSHAKAKPEAVKTEPAKPAKKATAKKSK